MTRTTTRAPRLLALGLAAAAILLAGCGDEGDNATDPQAYATATPTKAIFCAAMARVDAPFLEAGQYASREQKVEAAKKVTEFLNDTSKAAPTDIQDAANAKLEAIRSAADGDTSKLLDNSTLDATEKIKNYCAA